MLKDGSVKSNHYAFELSRKTRRGLEIKTFEYSTSSHRICHFLNTIHHSPKDLDVVDSGLQDEADSGPR